MVTLVKVPISLSFEGIICEIPKYKTKKLPQMLDGAADFLKRVKKLDYYKIYLYTRRDKDKIKEWVKENKISHYVSKVTSKREDAVIYLNRPKSNYNSAAYDAAYEEIKDCMTRFKIF